MAYARTRSGRFGEAAVLCLCVGAITVAVGDMSGFDTRSTRPCSAARAERDGALSYRDGANAGITIESRAFLPSTVCRWPDGGTVELVPSWVTPLTLLSLAGAALCAVCGVRTPAPASRS
ncbi:hypothetical protein ABR738_05325 [Streptomyces sp. Edi4]|uniref:hypothetical protein n=1 Tax=Streptomyces sp. Edi4 TaxID=3162527 RepID=UPI003305BD19